MATAGNADSGRRRPERAECSLPLVTIGLPVYNAIRHGNDRYFREALDSLLAQDYPNFELIISDNGSDDGTEAMCRAYAERDHRIQYHRAAANRGAAWNYNQVFRLGRGEYFLYAADDDMRDRTYVSRCVEAFRAHPQAVLCCSHIEYINEDGEPVHDGSPWHHNSIPSGATREQRIRQVVGRAGGFEIYGLIRSAALGRTNLFATQFAGDWVLILELCLLGGVIEIPEKLFRYRLFKNKTVDSSNATLAPPASGTVIKRSFIGLPLAWSKVIWRSRTSTAEKIHLTWSMLHEYLVRNKCVRVHVREDARQQILEALHAFRLGRVAGLGGAYAIATTSVWWDSYAPRVRRKLARVCTRPLSFVRRLRFRR
jgi:glycosyltransferase involved in cell wall biosynthesis